MHDLVVVGRCRVGTFLTHLRPQRASWQVTIDLTRMTFCEPLGLVGIAAFAEHALSDGWRVVMLSPSDLNVARYLARMRLGTTLAALGAEHGLPAVREHYVGGALLELTTFDGARGASALAGLVHQAVEQEHLDVANALHEGLCEAGQNVAHHSGNRRGFLAAQRTHYGRRMWFAVSDSGHGMLHTLQARGARTHAEALDLALQRGLSGTHDRHRGVGLPDILAQVSDLGGSLHIVSGDSWVTAWGAERRRGTSTSSLAGTLLQGDVHLANRPT